jgi:cell wall-associated NlpC family hydrolase
MRRRDTAAGLTLLALLAGLLIGTQNAAADPTYPSQNDVNRAKQHAASISAQVSSLQKQVSRSAAAADAADVALSSAAEDYDEAQVELQTSQQAAKAATDVSARANAKLGAAQTRVGQLAAQTYRDGGSIASLDVLLSPTGPDQVLERASMMHVLAEQRQQTVQQMDAARVVATTLDKQAKQALARQRVATAKVAAAKAVAQQRAQAAKAALATETTQRNALLVKLAAARKTTIAVERAREAGLARAAELRKQAQERAAAAAAARQAAERRTSSGGSSGSSSGSDSSGSGSSGSFSTQPTGGSSSGSSGSGMSAVSWARSRVGIPYQWGGAGPSSYDCSGLVMRAWQRVGVMLPHSSRLMYRLVEKISYSQLRPGDLIFYATNPSNEATIHHVAMYIGGGQMIEAPYTGADVRIVSLRMGDGAMPYAGRP